MEASDAKAAKIPSNAERGEVLTSSFFHTSVPIRTPSYHPHGITRRVELICSQDTQHSLERLSDRPAHKQRPLSQTPSTSLPYQPGTVPISPPPSHSDPATPPVSTSHPPHPCPPAPAPDTATSPHPENAKTPYPTQVARDTRRMRWVLLRGLWGRRLRR